jgi:hypothetical protein
MIFGNRTSRPTNWLKAGLDHARRVGRIEGSGFIKATGFLLNGEMFDDRFRNLPLFLTCNHTVHAPEGPAHSGSLAHEDALVVFQGMFDDTSPNVSSRFEQVLSFSLVADLDYTLLLLQRWPGPVRDIAVSPRLPMADAPIIVIGYPGGRSLSVSLEDNEAIGSERHRLYYRAPTEAGSTGSLVLNQYWEAVALHIGADRERKRNYGTTLSSILDHARSQLALVDISEKTATRIRASTSVCSSRPSDAPEPSGCGRRGMGITSSNASAKTPIRRLRFPPLAAASLGRDRLPPACSRFPRRSSDRVGNF